MVQADIPNSTDQKDATAGCQRIYCPEQELLEGKWEPETAFNAFAALGAEKGDPIKCRFWARSADGAAVQFKVGGVVTGKIRDSITFPLASEWIELGPAWTRYEIELTGADLSSMVGPFLWTVDRLHNGNKDVSFDLDTIYFVKTK